MGLITPSLVTATSLPLPRNSSNVGLINQQDSSSQESQEYANVSPPSPQERGGVSNSECASETTPPSDLQINPPRNLCEINPQETLQPVKDASLASKTFSTANNVNTKEVPTNPQAE